MKTGKKVKHLLFNLRTLAVIKQFEPFFRLCFHLNGLLDHGNTIPFALILHSCDKHIHAFFAAKTISKEQTGIYPIDLYIAFLKNSSCYLFALFFV